MDAVIGWDVGGANVKAARVEADPRGRGAHADSSVRGWRDKAALPEVLEAMAAELGPAAGTAVTMTAELSDAFRTKREGVGFVLDAVSRVAAGDVAVFTTDAGFLDVAAARTRPLDVAASNWMATATLAAGHVKDGLLVDIGSTTTDVIPLRDGRVVARGRTGSRAPRVRRAGLHGGGAHQRGGRGVPRATGRRRLPGGRRVLRRHRGRPRPAGQPGPGRLHRARPPTARPPTREFAAERLARVVCADVEMLGPAAIEAIAAAVADAQVRSIAAALAQVASRVGPSPPVVATGQGAFLAHQAAARCGLASSDLSAWLGVDVGTAAPAVAVAWLLLRARA